MRSDGDRIPVGKIKVSTSDIRRLRTPGMFSRRRVRGTIGRALPLCFGGKAFACPARIGAGLGMAHIDGPVEWQLDRREHSSPQPLSTVAVFLPECRMHNAILFFPRPVVFTPQLATVVAA